MLSKLRKLPRFQTEHIQLDAPLFNQVRLKLIRFKNPYRFTIRGLENIEIILDEEYWVCLDTTVSDNPIFAWIDFQIKNRDNLHIPIHCKLFYFHASADALVQPAASAILSEVNT